MLVVAVACSSPQKQAAEDRKTAASWAAAGALLAHEWSRGAVSDAYARSTARVAIDEVAALQTPSREAQLRAWRALEQAIDAHDRAAGERAFRGVR